MDLLVGIFIGAGLLFFWGVWIFGYWLPMAKEAQREFKRQEAREKAAAEQQSLAQREPAIEPPGA